MTLSAFCRPTETIRLLLLGAGLAILTGLSGCATVPEEAPPAPPPPPPAIVEPAPLPPPPPRPKAEVASWYGPGLNGHRTSTGERFNQNELTAASKTLPIGSHVKVTNPANGKSVVVRINDRGPHSRGRTMDLSKRAAQKLGITGKGIAHVEVTPVPLNREEDTGPAPAAPSTPSSSEPSVVESHI